MCVCVCVYANRNKKIKIERLEKKKKNGRIITYYYYFIYKRVSVYGIRTFRRRVIFRITVNMCIIRANGQPVKPPRLLRVRWNRCRLGETEEIRAERVIFIYIER